MNKNEERFDPPQPGFPCCVVVQDLGIFATSILSFWTMNLKRIWALNLLGLVFTLLCLSFRETKKQRFSPVQSWKFCCVSLKKLKKVEGDAFPSS